MAEENQEFGKLSVFGFRLKILPAVGFLSWAGCLASLGFLLAKLSVLSEHFATGQQENSKFSYFATESNCFHRKLINSFNSSNQADRNHTETTPKINCSIEENPGLFVVFCTLYGICISVILLFLIYFCLLIKTYYTRDKEQKEKVGVIIRRFCYIIAASKILLGFRYALFYFLEFQDDDLKNTSEEYIIFFLWGISAIIYVMDIIAGLLIIFGIKKKKKDWITGVLVYVIAVFLARLIIFIYFVSTDDDTKHILSLCLHIFFFSFSYMFLVILQGLMCEGTTETNEDIEMSEIQEANRTPVKKSYEKSISETSLLHEIPSEIGKNERLRSPPKTPSPVEKLNPKPNPRSKTQDPRGHNRTRPNKKDKDEQIHKRPLTPSKPRLDDDMIRKKVRSREKETPKRNGKMKMETDAKVEGWIEEGGQRYWGLVRDRALYLYERRRDRVNGEEARERIPLKEGERTTVGNSILITLKCGANRRFRVAQKNVNNWNLALDGAFSEEDIYENFDSISEDEDEEELESETDYENEDEKERETDYENEDEKESENENENEKKKKKKKKSGKPNKYTSWHDS